MARRSGPVALVVASILVLAIPVVMMAVSPHRDRGVSNVQIQFAAGDQQAPAAQSQGKAGTSRAGTAQPATGRNGGAGAGSVMIGDPNPSSPFPVPATSGLPVPVPSVSVPAINLHTVPKPHKFVLS